MVLLHTSLAVSYYIFERWLAIKTLTSSMDLSGHEFRSEWTSRTQGLLEESRGCVLGGFIFSHRPFTCLCFLLIMNRLKLIDPQTGTEVKLNSSSFSFFFKAFYITEEKLTTTKGNSRRTENLVTKNLPQNVTQEELKIQSQKIKYLQYKLDRIVHFYDPSAKKEWAKFLSMNSVWATKYIQSQPMLPSEVLSVIQSVSWYSYNTRC